MGLKEFLPQPPWSGPPVPKWCNIGWPIIPRSSNPDEEKSSEVEKPIEEVEKPIVDKPAESDNTDNTVESDNANETDKPDKTDKLPELPEKAKQMADKYIRNTLKYYASKYPELEKYGG